MKTLGGILAALIVLIQVPLWLGKGGWLRVSEVDRQLSAQQVRNGLLDARNFALEAEVRDLK
jgi:cell division protein FtsB